MAGYATPAWVNDASPAIDAAALTAIGHAIELAQHPYGVCSTGDSTAAKTVTIDYSGTLTLYTGLTIRVKFSYTNTATSPTLNVNGTGAVSIVSKRINNVGTRYWEAGEVAFLTYDGTNWVLNGGAAGDSILYFTSQAVSAANNAEIFRITDAAITANTVVLSCIFANPDSVTSNVTWASYAGYVAFSGVCTAATTANVILGQKGN